MSALQFLHLMESQGAAAHGYVRALAIAHGLPQRAPLMDAVHLLAIFHNGRPLFAHMVDMVVRQVHRHCSAPQALAQWQKQVTAALEEDRRWLMELMLYLGPSPYKRRRFAGEEKMRGLRSHIVTMLQSERQMSAMGAMICLAQRSDILRLALNNGFGGSDLAHPSDGHPALRSCTHNLTLAMLAAPLEDPKSARALAFGIDQMALLFSHLLDILEARQAHSLP